MSADDELSNALERRNDINEGKAKPKFNKKIPIATEFKEFSFKEIQRKYAFFQTSFYDYTPSSIKMCNVKKLC